MSIQSIEKLKLIASDGVNKDYFGGSVALDGDYAIVSARGDDDRGVDSGSVYIFKNDGNGNFTQKSKLTPSDGAYGDRFGSSVAISGDYTIVGAPGDDVSGSAYIFKNDGNGNFTQKSKLTGLAGDGFGNNVDICGNYAIISAPGNTSVYIFKKDRGRPFTEIDKLTLPNDMTNFHFGHKIAISGDYVIVSTKFDPAISPQASAYIFKKDRFDNFTQIAKMVGSSSHLDMYGSDVAINGDYAIVGAIGDDDGYGSAYLYKNIGADTFKRISILTPSDRTPGDRFGRSVDIYGDYILIGATLHGLTNYWGPSKAAKGSAFVYQNDGSDNFSEIAKLNPSDELNRDDFGWSVALNNDYAIVGASGHDENGKDAGAAYIYSSHESIIQIATYRIQYFSSDHLLTAQVQLYNKENLEIGSLRFYKTEENMPSNDTQSPSGHVECHLRTERYTEVIDLLRNEKPVFLHYNRTDNVGHLSTRGEPVGEGE